MMAMWADVVFGRQVEMRRSESVERKALSVADIVYSATKREIHGEASYTPPV